MPLAGSSASTASIVTATCNGSTSQYWQLTYVGQQRYTIMNKQSQLCINDPGNSHSSGTTMFQYPCDTTSVNAFWTLSYDTVSDTWAIINGASGLSLNASYADGSPVVQCNYMNSMSMRWKLVIGQFLHSDALQRPFGPSRLPAFFNEDNVCVGGYCSEVWLAGLSSCTSCAAGTYNSLAGICGSIFIVSPLSQAECQASVQLKSATADQCICILTKVCLFAKKCTSLKFCSACAQAWVCRLHGRQRRWNQNHFEFPQFSSRRHSKCGLHSMYGRIILIPSRFVTVNTCPDTRLVCITNLT